MSRVQAFKHYFVFGNLPIHYVNNVFWFADLLKAQINPVLFSKNYTGIVPKIKKISRNYRIDMRLTDVSAPATIRTK
jgi:hypothetical protein